MKLWAMPCRATQEGQVMNLQVYKLGFEEEEEPEIKLPAFSGSWWKQGSSRKTSTSVSLTTLKSLTMWITTNCGKFFKRWEYHTTLPVSWETCMQVKKQQTWSNWLVQNQESSTTRLCIVTLLILTYMQSTSCEILGWMNQSGVQITRKNINNLG